MRTSRIRRGFPRYLLRSDRRCPVCTPPWYACVSHYRCWSMLQAPRSCGPESVTQCEWWNMGLRRRSARCHLLKPMASSPRPFAWSAEPRLVRKRTVIVPPCRTARGRRRRPARPTGTRDTRAGRWWEESLAAAEDRREGQEPVLIDQVLGYQRVHDAQAAGDDHSRRSRLKASTRSPSMTREFAAVPERPAAGRRAPGPVRVGHASVQGDELNDDDAHGGCPFDRFSLVRTGRIGSTHRARRNSSNAGQMP
jgi:hypothetical protein